MFNRALIPGSIRADGLGGAEAESARIVVQLFYGKEIGR